MAADDAQGTMLAIRDIEIDTRRREVRRGADVVKLPKLSYRMLVVLFLRICLRTAWLRG